MKNLSNIALAAIVLATACGPKEKETAHVSDGQVLFSKVKQFVSFGEHRTGTTGDSLTSAWLKTEFDSLGVPAELVSFPLKQFIVDSSRLVLADKSVDIFPVWPVNDKLNLNVSAVTVDGDKLSNLNEVKGKLVLTRLKEVHGSSNQVIIKQINGFIKAGATGVLAVTENNTGEFVALNTLDHQKSWGAPVFIVAPNDTAAILSAITSKKAVKTDIKGTFKNVSGRNVLAKIGTGKKYVIVSTPISGWFTTGGERGPGIAIWLGLAKWVKENPDRFKNYTFVFTGHSGHELGALGARVFLDESAPKPQETRLWLHLGAAIAVRDWKEENGKWTLTDSVDSQRYIYYDPAVAVSFEKSFEKLKARKAKGSETNKPGGEGTYFHKSGYNKLVSLSHGHRLHHVRSDDEKSTSPEILAELEHTLQGFLILELVR